MAEQAKWYGVLSGNGNDSVSRLFPDYYVLTNEPYRLAKLAALTSFKEGEGREWAKDNINLEGEANYTIYVTFLESPETQAERRSAQNALDAAEAAIAHYDSYDDSTIAVLEAARNDAEDNLAEFEDTGPAWLCFEVFPVDTDDMRKDRPTYESLYAAFDDEVALVSAE